METKKKRGPKPFIFSEDERKTVERLSSVGVGHRQIAALVRDGIDVETLEKYFRAELDRGKAAAHAKVGSKLMQKIMDGDTAAMIFYCKTQMGWREGQDVNVSGSLGLSINIDLS